jgi:hypothetical protein
MLNLTLENIRKLVSNAVEINASDSMHITFIINSSKLDKIDSNFLSDKKGNKVKLYKSYFDELGIGIYENENDLINDNLTQFNWKYFLVTEKTTLFDCNDDFIKKLKVIHDFIGIIKKISKHNNSNEIVLISSENLINIKINDFSFDNVMKSFSYIKSLIEFINKDDTEKKLIFLNNTLIEQFSNTENIVNLSDIITNAKMLKNKLIKNYNMYLNDFSVDKVIDSFNKHKLQLLEEITNINNSLQNKTISFPFALFLSFSQFNTNHWFSFSNIILTFSFIIYCSIIMSLILIQKDILKDFDISVNDFISKYNSLDNEVKNSINYNFNNVTIKSKRIKLMLNILFVFASIILFISVIFLFTYIADIIHPLPYLSH